MNERSDIMKLSGISKSYMAGETRTEVISGADLTIRSGEMVALIAPSGTGKSTLLHMAGLLDTPTKGSLFLHGTDMSTASDETRTRARLNEIGFIYQAHHLLAEFSALENVMMPLWEAGVSGAESRLRAQGLLTDVGLQTRMDHRPGQLSGGEQQRVAIARAMANSPSLLLADEPTGNLDPRTSEMIFALLKRLVREEGSGALIATHNVELARKMDRIVTICDGATVTVQMSHTSTWHENRSDDEKTCGKPDS